MTERVRPAQRYLRVVLVALLVALLPAGHAFAQRAATLKVEPIKADALKPEDPFEGLNRAFFAVHMVLDKVVLRPLALGYKAIVPKVIRTGLHNVVTELSEPLIFANDVVQLRPKQAARTAGRFTVNAVVGIGGLLDPAAGMGMPHVDNGFGNTLGRYGMTEGPYLFLPFFGPSNFRDFIGLGVDFFADPLGWGRYAGDAPIRGAAWVVSGLDQRLEADPDLQRIEQMGTDTYATMRSLYLQNRRGEIRGGAGVQIEDLPEFEDVPQAAPAAADQATPSAALTAPHYGGPDAANFLAPVEERPAAPPGPPIEL
jgi:phospholipid-binding lipoprotein MlaA